MEIGVCHLPTGMGRARAMAVVAEEAGIGWFGLADSPVLYGALYPAIQHAAAATTRIRVGSMVTNPVTRHHSVHAANCAALEEAYPGRTFLGVAPGDSAVHAAGLRPGTRAQVAATVDAVRERVGDGMHLLVAAGGPKAAAAVPASADGVLLGSGMAPDQMTRLATAAGPAPRRLWTYVVAHLVDRADQVAEARAAVRAGVIAFSRQALATATDDKGVPPDLVEGLRDLYGQYRFDDHARPGSVNAQLLARHPVQEAYLFDRFAVVGTPDQVAERLRALGAAVPGLGVFMGMSVPDPVRHLQLVGRVAALLGQEDNS